MTPLEILKLAQPFAVEHNCTQHLAIDIAGKPCSSWSEEACKWCSIGAIEKIIKCYALHWVPPDAKLEDFSGNQARVLLEDAAKQLGFVGAAQANDSGKVAELYNMAIFMAENQENKC